MKIDGQPVNCDIDPSAGSTGRTSASKGKDDATRTGQTSPDRVEVSSEARLLSAALGAAQSAPDIRADRVEAVRQKLAKGQIGNDLDHLANTMLDSVIEKK